MNVVILVSHSKKITDGLKEMILEMVGNNDNIIIQSAGGNENRIGTDAAFILDKINEYPQADNIYLFGDLGSGIISIDMALDLIDDETLKAKCHYFNAPLVEGAFTAAIQCLVDPSFAAVKREVEHCIAGFGE